MKVNEFASSDWRTICGWLFFVVCALLAGFVLGWCWRDRTGALANVSILSAMTAFGTVGTAVAAVAVPLYQNWDRRREQAIQSVQSEWDLSEEVHRMSAMTRQMTNALKDSWDAPSVVEINHLEAQLNIAKQSIADRLGRMLIGDLLYLLVDLQNEARRRQTLGLSIDGMAVGIKGKPGDDEVAQTLAQRGEACYSSSFRWMERVMTRFDALGMSAPGVIKASVRAKSRFNAVGEGRVVRKSQSAT